MVRSGPLPPRTGWAGTAPIAFVDTNVMHEFASAEDISRAVDLKVTLGVSGAVERRRLRAQGTLWMAMSLDECEAPTLLLEDEALPLVMRHIVDSHRDGWLTLMFQFVRPQICPRWTLLNLDAIVRTNGPNDTIIVDDAAARGIPIVTRDAGLSRKAKARGVDAVSPEVFAARALSREEARARFFSRWDEHALPWVLQTTSNGRLGCTVVERQCAALRRWRTRMDWIWSDTPEVFVLYTDRGEILI